jgi:hypothetical protein
MPSFVALLPRQQIKNHANWLATDSKVSETVEESPESEEDS